MRKRHRILRILGGAAALVLALPFLADRRRPLPPGTRVKAGPFPAPPGAVQFLADTTAHDPRTGARVLDPHILDHILALVDGAQSLVIVDMFLWNEWRGATPAAAGRPAARLADALIAWRRAHPEGALLVLTDPINHAYGAQAAAPLQRLTAAGIPVVFTDLRRLPPSNPLYSRPAVFYGPLLHLLPPVRALLRAAAPHPFAPDAPPVPLASLARLLHFQANHRKLIVTDTPQGGLRALVTSFNPHDGSAAHDNVALAFGGAPARAAADAELDCLEWSAVPGGVAGGTPAAVRRTVAAARRRLAALPPLPGDAPATGSAALTWLTEGAVRDAVLEKLAAAPAGSVARVSLFYLADRAVVRALAAAARRGVEVRLLLDPNRDAFGRSKNGIPNRPVAAELIARTRRAGAPLQVRWADTRGEQFHVKAVGIDAPDGCSLLAGSSNWTRRNLADLNLEACLLVENDTDLHARYAAWFDRLWTNADGLAHSLPYETLAEGGPALWLKTALYRLQERTGLGTF